MSRTYLDYNASTPVAPEVASVMRALMDAPFGNPSSQHWAGGPARALQDKARQQVATLLGCAADEIVFTSGGSEANNHALLGAFFASTRTRKHIITTRIEHPAILAPCRFLESLGAEITLLPVDPFGRLDPDDLLRAITADTILISVMHANNEVGTIQPIAACAEIAREHGVALHTDAAQSVGKIPTRVDDLGVDLLTIAGHKLYAPKGIGALYVRAGTVLEPLIRGAGHEGGRRAGTESVMLTAALGKACALAGDLVPMGEVNHLRDQFWRRIQDRFGDAAALNGHPELRLPNTLNVSFRSRIGADILAAMPEVAASTGSACHAGRIELSPVLEAMGISPEAGVGAIRFSLGRDTTDRDIDTAMTALNANAVLADLRVNRAGISSN